MSAGKYTEVPWSVFADRKSQTVAIDIGANPSGGSPCIVHWMGFDSCDLPFTKRLANAKRIVACHNACIGMADPEAGINALRTQRGDLLEALLSCVAAIERTAHCTEADRLAAAKQARAAIANATGAQS